MESNKDESCSICLEPFIKGENSVKFQCNHKFHFKCGNDWLKKNNSCPICRTKVDIDNYCKEDHLQTFNVSFFTKKGKCTRCYLPRLNKMLQTKYGLIEP